MVVLDFRQIRNMFNVLRVKKLISRISLAICLSIISLIAFSVNADGTINAKSKKLVLEEKKIPEVINAHYQVKASFFALPIKAKISVKKLEQNKYQASINLKSPFFKVSQTEVARIQSCQLKLLSVHSTGGRIGASDWDEKVNISWPSRMVSYVDGNNKTTKYKSTKEPTGFTTIYAHQYLAINKHIDYLRLMYVQSKKGWQMDHKYRGVDTNVQNRFFDKNVEAHRFINPRGDLQESDMPTVWFTPDALGAFPLKMAMKLGVFRVEVNLKKLDASQEEVQNFFHEWGCAAP
jgi:hypothetical protein